MTSPPCHLAATLQPYKHLHHHTCSPSLQAPPCDPFDNQTSSTPIHYPVYFAFEDEDLDKVFADIKRNDAAGQPATATTGGYKLVVSSPAPKKLSSPTITNIQHHQELHSSPLHDLSDRIYRCEDAESNSFLHVPPILYLVVVPYA
ncbi:nicalin-1 [Tanacetum coccineum]|uniref:Nicalin-1 n=1 Tax=Tanacetum coccineum TaxID=301880 RepID=A0ABQ5EV03_9ASTR